MKFLFFYQVDKKYRDNVYIKLNSYNTSVNFYRKIKS